MIKIIDQKKYGLLLWGTKLGAQSFAQSNIQADSKRPFTDLREIGVRFNSQDATLFQYEHKENYHSYTIFRNLLDWRNRSGYYAVTIFVDDTFRAPSDKIQELLQELADTYSSKYYDATKNQIYQHAREDISLFEAILNQDKYQLMPAPGDTSTEASKHKKALLTYQNNTELQEYLSYLHPTEEPDIISLYLHQSGVITIPAETHLDRGLTLPTYPKNINIKVSILRLRGENHDVQFNVNNKKPLYQPGTNGEFTITKLSKRDSLSFELISEDYEWRESQQAYYKVADLENRGYKLELDLKKKPDFINLKIHFGLLKGNKVDLNENEKYVYITTKHKGKLSYPIIEGVTKVDYVEEKTQITIHYPGNSKVQEHTEKKTVSKNEYEFGVQLKPKDTKIDLTIVFPALEKISGQEIEIEHNNHTKKQFVRSGKVTVYDLKKGDRIYVSFKGNDDFEPFERKEIRITGQNEERINLNKKKKPKGGVLDAPLYQKILAIVLLIAIIVLVVWFVLMLFGEKDSTVDPIETKTDNNSLADFDEQLKDIEGNEWKYDSTKVAKLNEVINAACNKPPESEDCKQYRERLKKAIDHGKFRVQVEEWSRSIDTLEEAQLKELRNSIESRKGDFDKAYEPKDSTYNKLLNRLIKQSSDDKGNNPVDQKKTNTRSIDQKVNSLLMDVTFSQKATANNYKLKLNGTVKKGLKVKLDNYIEICKHFEVYNSLVKCLDDIETEQEDDVNDDFKCAKVGTILDFRRRNSNLRDYTWLSPLQKKEIVQKWRNLESKIYEINPNYKPR
jgi:hypothetical protein